MDFFVVHRRVLFAFAFFTVFQFAGAQVRLVCRDAETKSPIASVYIFCGNAPLGVSDREGMVELSGIQSC
ncbi:hypothetical protein, partial [Oceanibaculum nanhaiense]|uniref:hypothetical protein n=1 Tax=Oceanibaculum nanhaiense TaxID=1909734 RepID=UPI00396DAB34